MQKIYFFAIILTIVLSFNTTANAQIVEISGKQKIENGNINFEGKQVYFPMPSKIISYSGTKTSFSLRRQNTNLYQFYYTKGKFTPEFDSVVIEPGMYLLYPDLPAGADSIEIKLKLSPIKK